MKKKLLYLVLLLSAGANAQIVTIPNAAFKEVLLNQLYTAKNSAGDEITIDANDDGEIQVTEALAVWELFVGGSTLGNLEGIEVFENLRRLDCQSGQLVTLDVQGLQHLEYLHCEENEIVTLDVSNMAALTEIWAQSNNLSSINISGLPNLEKLLLYDNHLTSLNYADSPNLKSIDIGGGNNFTSFNLTGLNQLESFTFDDMYVPVTSVTIANLPNLDFLQMGYAQLQELNLINLPSLTQIIAVNNPFTALNLSGCRSLETVWLDSTDLLYLNVKNGANIIDNLNLNDNPQLEIVCVDQGEEDEVVLSLDNSGSENYQIFTTCPDMTAYNTIAGMMRLDADADGCEGSDPALGWKNIHITDGTTNTTVIVNKTGTYNYNTVAGDLTLTPQLNTALFSVVPASVSVNFTDPDENVATENFCVTAVGVHNDAEIVVVPIIGAQPGFDATYQVIYRNIGNQNLSGSVSLNFEDAYVDLISSTPAAATALPGSLTWNFVDLQPSEERVILLTFNVNGPMEVPPIVEGDVLNYSATVTIPGTDETPWNNTFGIKQDVVGSFDPNDISCLEGHTAAPEAIGDFLHYNINFENTGNAAATFIVIENDINSSQFDINTLEILYASHPMAAIVEGNKIKFRFDDIGLGAQEKGNVTYKIKTLETLEEGEEVMQEANIFFDYNFPVATNEATTTFATLSRGEFAMNNTVKVYPNPSTGIVNIKADSAIQSLELFDVQGRLLQSSTLHEVTGQLDISQRATGMYLLKVKTEKGIKVERLMKY